MKIKQSYDLSSQSKSRRHRMFAPSRLAALVKEMIVPFSCPNHGWKRSKQRRKCKFAVFSTRGRRSTVVRGWLRASKQTSWGLKKFTQWLGKRKIGFGYIALFSLSANDIVHNTALNSFFVCFKHFQVYCLSLLPMMNVELQNSWSWHLDYTLSFLKLAITKIL